MGMEFAKAMFGQTKMGSAIHGMNAAKTARNKPGMDAAQSAQDFRGGRGGGGGGVDEFGGGGRSGGIDEFSLNDPSMQLPKVSINPTNAPLPEEETDEDISGGVPGFDPMKRLSRNLRNSGNIY